MPLKSGDAVYIKPSIDTGEVRVSHPNLDHDVFCDSAVAVERYNESLLEKLPHKSRQLKDGFLVIRRAKVTFGRKRKLTISHHIILNDGSISPRKFHQIRVSQV